MEQASSLELFLRDQSDDGVVADTSESFSISREKALEKLSSSQMPFDGAWALKVIQFAVAGAAEAITVHLRKKDTEILIDGEFSFTLDELEKALFDGSYFIEGPLLYLVTALRALAFNEKRGIWLALKDEPQALVWNGKEIQRVDLEGHQRGLSLTVSSDSLDEEQGLFGTKALRAGSIRNAATSQALCNMAHVCPVPLTIDGRRIDALELNPNHGWSPTSQLLVVGFDDCDLPTLRLPASTKERAHQVDTATNEGLKVASEGLQEIEPEREVYSLAYLLSAHIERVKQGETYEWKELEGQSLCYWVRHGVVIQSEAYNVEPDTCSVGCFISAEGLETDLTGFGLVQDEEKARRFEVGRQILKSRLADSENLDFDRMVKEAKSAAKTGGIIGVVAGAGLSFVAPIYGILFLGAGAWCLFAGGAEDRKRRDSYKQAFERLQQNL